MSTLENIWKVLSREPTNPETYADLFGYLRNLEAEDKKKAHQQNKLLRELLVINLPVSRDKAEMYEVYRHSLLFDAKTDFDSYMLYLEIDRKPSERFYQPRRKRMTELVRYLQMLADDELDELFLSMPPRVGKTTLMMLFVTWIIGRDSEKSNLYSAFSDIITKAFYNGILEILNDSMTYRWHDVFPEAKIAATNAQDETINIDRKKRYPSITCRSLYGTLNGACDCNGMLISDDLIGGIEEALNKDRMIAAWSKVDNNLIPRSKQTAKILWCGTRWSIIDPIGLRLDLLQSDERFKGRRYAVINLPAMNENDHSNFEYEYDVGFNDDYYRMRRASFERNNDIASWNAQYMGQPIEREGTVFEPGDMRFYNGELPDGEPDRVFVAVDPAFGGGDFVAAPVCYQYGNDIYVHDVVYSNADKKITQPLLAEAVIRHKVTAMKVEANKSTEAYKEGIEDILKKKGYRLSIQSKAAPNNVAKEQRIFDKAPDIRSMMVFRESGKRTGDYEQFMQNVYSFKVLGRNKHDDAPDSLSMAIDMVLNPTGQYSVFKRPF